MGSQALSIVDEIKYPNDVQVMHMNVISLINNAQYFSQVRASTIIYTLAQPKTIQKLSISINQPSHFKYLSISSKEHFNQATNSTIHLEHSPTYQDLSTSGAGSPSELLSNPVNIYIV